MVLFHVRIVQHRRSFIDGALLQLLQPSAGSFLLIGFNNISHALCRIKNQGPGRTVYVDSIREQRRIHHAYGTILREREGDSLIDIGQFISPGNRALYAFTKVIRGCCRRE